MWFEGQCDAVSELSPQLGRVLWVGCVIERGEAVIEGEGGLTLRVATTTVGFTKTNQSTLPAKETKKILRKLPVGSINNNYYQKFGDCYIILRIRSRGKLFIIIIL